VSAERAGAPPAPCVDVSTAIDDGTRGVVTGSIVWSRWCGYGIRVCVYGSEEKQRVVE